ncbi:unnamed protein product [Kluyveromyces dobzhanskii CBS 2104]|uniref:ethanolamine-phosphate cytidylyltransferase n=1 Tax=Kluyveromyces dobzhanskii CBS 2104 TaxID=1427455 RepID=A0A0A8L2U8_9SACH|nr:unnamed protein product [Kluyveromyces dobzhanskii CBS 2104]
MAQPQLYENKVWIDGCFDFTHHGHSGAILQAKRTIPRDKRDGSVLICGVHNDADIEHNKGGRPVMQEQERYEHTQRNRWCDVVVKDAPYVTDPAVLDSYGCKYVVHGDDITTDANGEDCYQQMKDAGRFQVVKRTEGVSTTDIIGRILRNDTVASGNSQGIDHEKLVLYSTGKHGYEPWCWVFGSGFADVVVEGVGSAQDENWVVVREPDGFDLFNVGHINELKALKDAGKRVCCSLSVDSGSVDSGSSVYMTLEERCLSVLSCDVVDAVMLGTPPSSTLPSSADICLTNVSLKKEIVQRINDNRDHYIERNMKKAGGL